MEGLLEEMEKIIEGGLRLNTVYLLRGVPASGKTLFALTVANELMLNGKPVIYLTTELSPEELKESTKAGFGWDFGEFERKGLLLLLDGYSWRLGKADQKERRADITSLSDMSVSLNRWIEEYGRKANGQRILVVFDTVSSLLLHNDLADVVKFMQLQVARFREAKVSGLLLLEAGISDESVIERLSFFVDGVFETRLRQADSDIERQFRVLAVRRAMHYAGWLPFRPTPGGFEFAMQIQERMWEGRPTEVKR